MKLLPTLKIMKSNKIISVGFFLLALSVAIGAFGAHSLKPILIANARLDTFQKAEFYQFICSFAIILLGFLQKTYPEINFKLDFNCILASILLFSGSLYALCLTNVGLFGAITPIGGILMIFAFANIGQKVYRNSQN